MQQVPQDVLQLVFEYIYPTKLCFSSLNRVCKLWCQVVDSEHMYDFALRTISVHWFFAAQVRLEFDEKSTTSVLPGIATWTRKQTFSHLISFLQIKVKKYKELDKERQAEMDKYASLSDYFAQHFAGCHPPTPGLQNEERPQRAQNLGIVPKGFKVHPDSNLQELTLHFSVPHFDELTKFMIHAMDKILKYGYSATEYQGALQLYHKFMILNVKYPHLFLVPPFEVTACWYSHMTRPALYHKYCSQLISKYGDSKHVSWFNKNYNVIPASATCFFMTEYHLALLPEAWQQTWQLWQHEFNEPMLPTSVVSAPVKITPQFGYFHSHPRDGITYIQQNLLGVQTTASLMHPHLAKIGKMNSNDTWNSSLLNITGQNVYNDLQFFVKLQNAIQGYKVYSTSSILKSYERYLYFLTVEPHAAPSILMDLAWHAHMCNPVGYIFDTSTWFGHVLDHDPTFMPTMQQQQSTMAAWFKMYNTHLQKDHTYYLPLNLTTKGVNFENFKNLFE